MLPHFFHISIHVPAWGTTLFLAGRTQQCRYFNPRSRVGNDTQELLEYQSELRFQSTFPRGERQWVLGQYTMPDDFNPRSRVGNDRTHLITTHWYYNFNPRSRVGNDLPVIPHRHYIANFNPRSRVGNDGLTLYKLSDDL